MAAVVMGVGATAAVGLATQNPIAAGAAGVAAGTAASLTTGAVLQAFNIACQRNPDCVVPPAMRGSW
jgi:hypothetical protein